MAKKFQVPVSVQQTGRVFNVYVCLKESGGSPWQGWGEITVYPVTNDYDTDALCWNTRDTVTLGAGAAVSATCPTSDAGIVAALQMTLPAPTYGLLAKITGYSVDDLPASPASTYGFDPYFFWEGL